MKDMNVLFETSWEVCNKVGGIHTVVSTKAKSILDNAEFEYILIGPDLWREEGEHPEFEQDDELFSDWKEQFCEKSFSVKTGRWKIPGRPKVLLIDFYSLISRKDEIFSKYWEDYKLDSLSGQWDYIEPALFGTAAGELIQDMCLFYEDFRDGAMAHFHEWMTGSGILHLKKHAPYVGTVFTTHATSLGRSIAGNGMPLYSKLNEFNPAKVARELGVISKQSMESLSAIEADAYSTVSEITALECKQFFKQDPNLVTPNGFEDSFVPEKKDFDNVRNKARKKLIEVASALGYNASENDLLVATSGRYEYKNKGIDVFLDALAKLEKKNPGRDILAFILVPAGISGPRPEITGSDGTRTNYDKTAALISTHYLSDCQNDPVVNYCKEGKLSLNRDSNVKLVFVPSYLNEMDGIFNISYYDLLIGFDLTVFPSYYEPWGYTPMESLAFSIPTITCTLAGFGKWVNDLIPNQGNGIRVLERTDSNYEQAAEQLCEDLLHYSKLSGPAMEKARSKAFDISRTALWKELSDKYFEIYEIASKAVSERKEFIELPRAGEITYVPTAPRRNTPSWKKIFIEAHVPKELEFLKELSMNLWWSWNNSAKQIWEKLDPVLWEECEYNPVLLLERVNYKRLKQLGSDKDFLAKTAAVKKEFREYMDMAKKKNSPSIAYFSMEYGIHDSLKVFSGGLGILAGDFLKEASDMNVDISAFGLLYRYGYFKQVLTSSGAQEAMYLPEQFSKLPVSPVLDKEGKRMSVQIAFPGRVVYVYIWKVNVGRINLYLLDTDNEKNQDRDRSMTHSLYGGDLENRLKQEILLGIGGIRTINALSLKPDIYHSNEGHSAFIGIERLWNHIRDSKLTFNEALEAVRSSTLFTTHTPVPAGHDSFPEDLCRTYMGHYPERLGISWEKLLSLGRKAEHHPHDKFNMSFLAARLSKYVNGVSKLHGLVSRPLFADIWPGFLQDESPIGYVTNGVHHSTWTAPEWLEATAGKEIKDIPDLELWQVKQGLKAKMKEELKEILIKTFTDRGENPAYIMEIADNMDPNVLTIGFARRFATYKRAHLLFSNLERLSKIVNHPKRPVSFLFAGKAHPNDKAGQDLIKHVVEISKRPEFLGKIVFIPGYDINIASKLVQGVDIWMNTPTRPLEASGTSGEKAVMNGTMHFSVLDGWWVEGYKKGAGWALPEERTYYHQDFQNELDAETIYQLLENEIAPAYYKDRKAGYPVKWVSHIRKTMTEVAPEFTTTRMMNDYLDRYYHNLEKSSKQFSADNFATARELAAWKDHIRQKWNDIEVLSVSLPGNLSTPYTSGREYTGKLSVDLKGLSPNDIKLELLISKGPDTELIDKQEFKNTGSEKGIYHYEVKVTPTYPGGFSFGIRLVPKHPLLEDDHEFALNLWV